MAAPLSIACISFRIRPTWNTVALSSKPERSTTLTGFSSRSSGCSAFSAGSKRAFPNPELESGDPFEFSSPVHMTLSSIRRDLDQVKARRAARHPKQLCEPPSPSGIILGRAMLTSPGLFRVSYLSILTRLYESAIFMTMSHARRDCMDGSRRTEALWCALDANKQFLNAWMTIPFELVSLLAFPHPVASVVRNRHRHPDPSLERLGMGPSG